jgi:hypothetical protein
MSSSTEPGAPSYAQPELVEVLERARATVDLARQSAVSDLREYSPSLGALLQAINTLGMALASFDMRCAARAMAVGLTLHTADGNARFFTPLREMSNGSSPTDMQLWLRAVVDSLEQAKSLAVPADLVHDESKPPAAQSKGRTCAYAVSGSCTLRYKDPPRDCPHCGFPREEPTP